MDLMAGKPHEDFVVVSPDVGSVARARKIAQKINCPMAIIDKRRPMANQVEIMNIIGDVKGKTCLLVDDLIDTAGTICQGAQALHDNGAKEIYACCTHAVLSGPAIDRIEKSPIKKLVILDTINMPEEKRIEKIQILSVAHLLAKAIENIYLDKKMREVYDK
jgi:ribose-phosphate pyrophosphokinase